ncbi:hypothetical protein EDC26_102208 [Paralcaligenes ureilyticus]|uniref:DUF1109 domain-containing protein n=2 Tax=Paralcaligenes ureilyticus TaxID=627131 RepID=A0A4R3MAT9_9BURK|nr:hypothetical protein EDC26_102208 [Paralcaligenes ureilyticus]
MLSIPTAALIVAMMGVRPDIGTKMADPLFLRQELASLAVALVAAWAALVAGIPGEPRWKRWAPIVPVLLWISMLGRQCWSEWMHSGASGMEFRADWMCLPGIAMISAVPALAMVVAIRRGARLHSFQALLWGSLAAAALANAALRLFHMEDAALMVIVWQFGSVLLLTAILTVFRNALIPARTARPYR